MPVFKYHSPLTAGFQFLVYGRSITGDSQFVWYRIGLLTSFVIGMKVISIYENRLARFAFSTNNLWRYQTFLAHD